MAEDLQLLADACEEVASARYERRQKLVELVADAVRRAEAMKRLELSLSYGDPLRPLTSWGDR